MDKTGAKKKKKTVLLRLFIKFAFMIDNQNLIADFSPCLPVYRYMT